MKYFWVLVISLFLSRAVLARHPIYFGPIMGWGSTDWRMLTKNCNENSSNPSEAIACANVQAAAPISAGDNGLIVGATLGYEIEPFFALEGNFFRFPTTTVTFDPDGSYYTSSGLGPLLNSNVMQSKTYNYDIVGKFMVPIAHTGIRGFANAGLGVTHRSDPLNKKSQANATFGVGLNYVFSNNIMLEGGFQYTAGYGKATYVPAVYYIPFLYSLHLKIAYLL